MWVPVCDVIVSRNVSATNPPPTAALIPQPCSHCEGCRCIHACVCVCGHCTLRPCPTLHVILIFCSGMSKWQQVADRRRWCNNPKSIIVNVVFLAFQPPSVRALQHCYCWQFRSLVCTSKVQCARRNLAPNHHLAFVSSSDRGMFAKYTNSQVQNNHEQQRCLHIRMIIIILLIKSALCFLHVHVKAVYTHIIYVCVYI